MGAAFGIYMGTDLALVLAVLPHLEDNAQDWACSTPPMPRRSRSRRSSAPPC